MKQRIETSDTSKPITQSFPPERLAMLPVGCHSPTGFLLDLAMAKTKPSKPSKSNRKRGASGATPARTAAKTAAGTDAATKTDLGDAGFLPPELAWVAGHPRMRMQSAKEQQDAGPLREDELAGAPNEIAVTMLRRAMAAPAKLMDTITAMFMEAAKARHRNALEAHKAMLRERVAAEKMRLEAESRKADPAEESKLAEVDSEERRSVKELRKLAASFRNA